MTKKRNGRQRRPHDERSPHATTTSPAVGVAANKDATFDAVSVDEDAMDDNNYGQGPSKDPSPHQDKSRGGEICCPHETKSRGGEIRCSRETKSRGGEIYCSRETKSRGAIIKRAPKSDIDTPVSASLPHTTEESIWPAGVSSSLT